MILKLAFSGDYVVVWKRETTLISAKDVKLVRDDRISVVGTSLNIAKVNNKDSGNYTCEINTAAASQITVVLNVLGKYTLTHFIMDVWAY